MLHSTYDVRMIFTLYNSIYCFAIGEDFISFYMKTIGKSYTNYTGNNTGEKTVTEEVICNICSPYIGQGYGREDL